MGWNCRILEFLRLEKLSKAILWRIPTLSPAQGTELGKLGTAGIP